MVATTYTYAYDHRLGRETNTTIRTSRFEGTATVPDFTSPAYPYFTDTTIYPDGTSDYRVHTDRRGVRTVSWNSSSPDREEHISQTYHPTNLAVHVLLSSNVTYRNGHSISLKSWAGGWTRETLLTAYPADGCRRDIALAEASDLPGVLTNRLTQYDFLGRAIATLTPGAGGTWIVASNSYDGASARLIRSETTGHSATTYLYDAQGDSAATVQCGIMTGSESRFETISNEIWRATVQSTSADGVTNAVTTTREQMTGLSDALRARTVTVSENGAVTTVVRSFDPATKTETTTVWRDGGTPVIRSTKFGALVETHSLADRIVSYFDAFLTPYHVRTFHPVTGALRSRRFLDMDEATWEPVYTETWYGSLKVTGESQFDAFGRETVRIDALGNAVTNAFDALGRRVSAFGATYPVTHGYDTAGRMASLSTTRDGCVWDMTRWLYDQDSGIVTNKVYTDDSTIAYTYTADGRPTRTTWARGAWRQHAYNAEGLLAATTYSDATPAVSLTYDAIQRLASASNAAAQYAYLNSNLGTATNETATVGGNTVTLIRGLDVRHRLADIALEGRLHATYSYDVESRLSGVSNAAFTVDYAYTSDGWDAGYTIVLTNGTVLSRAATCDFYRRHLVTGVSNAVAGSVACDYHYKYDLLGRVTSRNTDGFGYNARSEVTSAVIQPSSTNRYEYDGIGNAFWASFNTTTNIYNANALNQYTKILCASSPPHEDTPAYDLDGNMLTNGVWSYAWDVENRLTTVYSNSTLIVSNTYDHLSRRVLKATPTATNTFIYDGWNLVRETIINQQSTITNLYVWGKDLSRSIQGAGGVGGLLAACMAGAWYFPLYDNNGNVTAYADESGTLVAAYVYDAFGRTIAQSGPMTCTFPHRFSTKHFDTETGMYYYGMRFYLPSHIRWLNRDPIEERGDNNLYSFCNNASIASFDPFGLATVNAKVWWETYDRKLLFLRGIIKTGDPLYASVRKSSGAGSIAYIKRCDYLLVFVQVDKPPLSKENKELTLYPLVSSRDNGRLQERGDHNAVPHYSFSLGNRTYTKLWSGLPAQSPLDQLANPINVIFEDNKIYRYSLNDVLYIHRVNGQDIMAGLVSRVSVWVDAIDDDDRVQVIHSMTINIKVTK